MKFNIGAEAQNSLAKTENLIVPLETLITEEPSLVSSQILPPKQAEVFGSR